MTSSNPPWSLTSHLLSTSPDSLTRATQCPFLHLAATGALPKETISTWLANDRLYMQGYIRLTGHLLKLLHLPSKPVPRDAPGDIQTRLLDWLVAALVNIRREERFFVGVAERYDVSIDISAGGVVPEERKLEGLKKFERLFASLTEGAPHAFLPWLEGVVVFWATETVYFEAWKWAERQAGVACEEGGVERDPSRDADGGAMRKEFIPNWTNEEFGAFVETLRAILDEGVREAVGQDEGLKRQVVERGMARWKELLEAEEAFWPKV